MSSDNIHVIPIIFLLVLLAGSTAAIIYNIIHHRNEPTFRELICASLVHRRANTNLYEVYRDTTQRETIRRKIRAIIFLVTRVLWLLLVIAALIWLTIWCYDGLIDAPASLVTILSAIITTIGLTAVTLKRPKRFDDENNIFAATNYTPAGKQRD